MGRSWVRSLRWALVVLFVAGGLAALPGLDEWISRALHAATERLGLPVAWRTEALDPALSRPPTGWSGTLRTSHPRILLPELGGLDEAGRQAFWDGREAGYRATGIPPPPNCDDGSLLGQTACWLTTADASAGDRAVQRLGAARLTEPQAQAEYGNLWELALAFDLLHGHPALDEPRRRAVARTIRDGLEPYLRLLDGRDASLWHGRVQLASQAFLGAIVLEPDDAETRALVGRVEAHFLDALAALALTQAWPEGYNYWINSRAFALVLGAVAYVNAFEDGPLRDGLLQVLRRVGQWPVYALRPDGRVEGLGDEGPRIDLKDETRRVLDLIAQATRDPAVAVLSRHIGERYGAEGYYRDYRWGFRLFNDPTVAATGASHADLGALAGLLPTATVFGPGALNQVYVRQGWRPGDTFIAFRAGHSFTHHGHYDAGHLSLHKWAPLAIASGTYGGFTSPHRLDYTIRTVAKNSLLVLRPGEVVQPNALFAQNVADGGQRLSLPTGSAIRSTEHWRGQLGDGLHLEGGELLGFAALEGDFAYVSADLTGAYNNTRHDTGGRGGKVRRVSRELLYLYEDDRLIMRDRVMKTDPRFVSKWLLHSIGRPEVDGLVPLVGTPDDGIAESTAATALIRNGPAALRIDRLLPADARLRTVGGPGFRSYVEADGDDAVLDGRNMEEGARHAPWFDDGAWRIEIQPAQPVDTDDFLVVLGPGPADRPAEPPQALRAGSGAHALAVGRRIVLFLDRDVAIPLELQTPEGADVLHVVGLPPHRDLRITQGGALHESSADGAGTVRTALSGGGGLLQLAW